MPDIDRLITKWLTAAAAWEKSSRYSLAERGQGAGLTTLMGTNWLCLGLFGGVRTSMIKPRPHEIHGCGDLPEQAVAASDAQGGTGWWAAHGLARVKWAR